MTVMLTRPLRNATMAITGRLSVALSYSTRQAIKELPGVLALRYFADSVRKGNLASRKKRVCVDGFPRSANTYALHLLTVGLGVPERDIAHHTHSVANVRRALEWGIPTFVLIRRPLECCSSLVAFGASRSLEDSLNAYAAFYEGIIPLRGRLTIVETERLIEDPLVLLGQVSRVVNCNLPVPGEPEIAAKAIAMSQSGQRPPHRSPMPNAVKDRMKGRILEGQRSARISALVTRCERVRDTLVSSPSARETSTA